MHRPSISTIILLAFAASAVFGLCAMTQQMMMHGGLCATTGIGSMVCPENPLQHLGLLAAVLAVLAAIASIHAADTGPVRVETIPAPRWRERSLLSWSAPPGLLSQFSDGILNPKTF